MPQLSANLVFGTLLDVNVGKVSLTARNVFWLLQDSVNHTAQNSFLLHK